MVSNNEMEFYKLWVISWSVTKTFDSNTNIPTWATMNSL